MTLQRIALTLSVSALLAVSVQQSAHADSIDSLLDMLLANHTITQQQYNQLKASVAKDEAARAAQLAQQAQLAKDAANQAAQQAQLAKDAQAAANQAAQNAAQQAAQSSAFSVGPTFGDIHYGNATLHVGGKLQADEPVYVNTNYNAAKLGSAGNIRRMYLDLRGTFDPNWNYRVEFGSSSGALNVAWAYFGYQGLAPFNAWFGYQKTMYSLDNETADENRIFTEAPLPSAAFVSSKEIGLAAFDNGTWWQASGGVFNGAATTAPTAGTDNGWQISGRGTLFPINQNNMVAEIGGSIAYQKAPSTNSLGALKSQPEENTVATSLVSTGTITNVNAMTNAGIEASAEYGPLLAEGEWLNAMVDRTAPTRTLPSQPYFSGWYGQAAWVITGESHPWDAPTATYKGIAPAHPFDPGAGAWGAFEVAARYSYVDLTDIGGLGLATSSTPQGKQSDVTAAMNWYLTQNVRGELDWTHVMPIHAPNNFSGNFNGISADIVEVRGQIVW